MITSGALGAGSRLPIEKYLAGELGVSRRSLREGCAPWCIMGVLEARQGEVTYVTSLEPSLLLVPMSFMADLHAASVDDAAFLYVAHDVAPRALSPKIKGFVQPKSWFVDFSPISMVP